MNDIRVFTEGNTVRREGITVKSVKRWADTILETSGQECKALSIILTNDDTIHSINRKYRGIDRPTDVLSFAERECPFPDAGNGLEMLGEIYISMDRASVQAVEYRVEIRDETMRLLVHGILHLLGYDHERSKKDARIMEAREDEILLSMKNRQ